MYLNIFIMLFIFIPFKKIKLKIILKKIDLSVRTFLL